jgi:nucleoside 2-deoxyribosyltransferase
VVVKCGAMGAVVHRSGSSTTIGAFQTKSVFPIGSGDVFAAGFAWAWGERGMDAVQATRVGSLAAARWCGSGLLPLPAEVGELKSDLAELTPRRLQVYLAAPFFTLAELWLVGLCRDTMRAFGAEVFSPLHDVGRQADDIAAQDLAALDSSDAILAILDGGDTGTWFEVGWARKHGKPVVAYCDPRSEQQLKMALGTQVEVHSDLSTAVYRALWAPQG